jgi:hypothetical protein
LDMFLGAAEFAHMPHELFFGRIALIKFSACCRFGIELKKRSEFREFSP